MFFAEILVTKDTRRRKKNFYYFLLLTKAGTKNIFTENFFLFVGNDLWRKTFRLVEVEAEKIQKELNFRVQHVGDLPQQPRRPAYPSLFQ